MKPRMQEVPPLAVPAPSADVAKMPRRNYLASIFPKDEPIDPDLASLLSDLQKRLALDQLWLLVQRGAEGDWNEIGRAVYHGFRSQAADISEGRVGLVIQSLAGQASDAYRITRLFQRRTKNLVTIVPAHAKSAATLIAIGGRQIVMGRDAELGPLDVQLYDEEKDDWDSALSAVQSLERLNAYALQAFDQAMMMFVSRMPKRPESLLPVALEYATSMLKPLVAKIDTIELTRKSRELKVAEDYAIRLMRVNYDRKTYTKIASSLVERFSTHDFVIDRTEAGEGIDGDRSLTLGLEIAKVDASVDKLLSQLCPLLERALLIGQITEIASEQESA